MIKKTNDMHNAKWLTTRELITLTGMSYQRARKFADDCGATIKLGARMIRYDKPTLEKAMNEMLTANR